ncbi:MAG: tyrosine-type recombinase/integrase, partial [Chloroflexi bacterium]|nr:tyrosine-type recombinase/integrase [Chloroflexota bacterium]
ARLTVAAFLDQWLNDFADVHVRAKTAENYRHKLERHVIPRIGHVTLSALEPDHVSRMEADLLKEGRVDGKGGLSAQSVLHVHRVLADALTYAVAKGKALRNVAVLVKPPRPAHREMAVLDADSLNAALDALREGDWYAAFYLDAYTGLRRSELLALRWRDVDLDMGTLSVVQTLHQLSDGRLVFEAPKSRKGRRSVALSPSTVLALRAHREQEEAVRPLGRDSLVFANLDGSPLRPASMTQVWRRLTKSLEKKAKDAGQKSLGLAGVRLHDLRHTHATLMLKAGVHPKVVQERLGHSNISITLDTYSHVVPGLQEAAALRFEEGLQRKPTPQAV